MTVLHGACCGPQHATNVHRDCPRVFAGWGGEVLVCGCLICHGKDAQIALEIRGNDVSEWENGSHNKAAPGGVSAPLIQGPRRLVKESTDG